MYNIDFKYNYYNKPNNGLKNWSGPGFELGSITYHVVSYPGQCPSLGAS